MHSAREVGAYEAKTHLPRLLREVAKGEEFVITVKGDRVARLIPEHPERPSTVDAIRALREARRGVRLGGLSVRELIDEGRR